MHQLERLVDLEIFRATGTKLHQTFQMPLDDHSDNRLHVFVWLGCGVVFEHTHERTDVRT